MEKNIKIEKESINNGGLVAPEKGLNVIVQWILGVYLLSLGIIYMYGINLDIESTLLGKEKQELLKQIPFFGTQIIDSFTLNILGVFIIFVTFIILVLVKSTTKGTISQLFFKILITILGFLGININQKIIQEIQSYKDIIYENNWFYIKKIYTLGEKKAFLAKEIKEYCLNNNLSNKHNQEILVNLTDDKIKNLGIEEISKLVKTEIEYFNQKLIATLHNQNILKYVLYIGLTIAVIGCGYYTYKAIITALDNSPEQDYAGKITKIVQDQGNHTNNIADTVKESTTTTTNILTKGTTTMKEIALEQNGIIDTLNKTTKQALQEQGIEILNLKAENESLKTGLETIKTMFQTLKEESTNKINEMIAKVNFGNTKITELTETTAKTALRLEKTQTLFQTAINKVADYSEKLVEGVKGSSSSNYAPQIIKGAIKKGTTGTNFGSGTLGDATVEVTKTILENIN